MSEENKEIVDSLNFHSAILFVFFLGICFNGYMIWKKIPEQIEQSVSEVQYRFSKNSMLIDGNFKEIENKLEKIQKHIEEISKFVDFENKKLLSFKDLEFRSSTDWEGWTMCHIIISGAPCDFFSEKIFSTGYGIKIKVEGPVTDSERKYKITVIDSNGSESILSGEATKSEVTTVMHLLQQFPTVM